MELKKVMHHFRLGDLIENVDIKEHLTIKTSALCKYLILPNSFESLIIILGFLKNKKYYLLGYGSNVVFSSKNTIEYVILLKNIKPYYKIEGNQLTVSSNFSLKKISYILARNKYTNLEFFSSIPGTIGGAVIMNSGCYKSEVKDFLISCKCMDEDGNIFVFKNNDLAFSYRSSKLKGTKFIILEAVFEIEKTLDNPFLTIEKWRNSRIISQPLEYPSCGSVFRNPEDNPAWYYIEAAGLRGKKHGGAMFSSKHCNFIININNATGEDVMELIFLAKRLVFEKFNIELKEEVLLYNFDFKS